MNIPLDSFVDELSKIAGGLGSRIAEHGPELAGLGILAAPSLSGLAGKPWKEKSKEKAEVLGLGTLAAPSAIKMLSKKAAMRPGGQAAIMKSIARHGLRPEVAARHGLTPATRAAAPAVQQTVRPASLATHSQYADFMPAGRFSGAGGSLPAQQQQALRQKSQVMAKQVAPAARASNIFKGV